MPGTGHRLHTSELPPARTDISRARRAAGHAFGDLMLQRLVAAWHAHRPAAPTRPGNAGALVNGVVNSGGGAPLDTGVRAAMEGRFGHNFSSVRVHTDSRAHESARSVGAQAYTVGSDIAFQRGMYDPSSRTGQHLLAHELTHVVQQRSGAVAASDTGAGVAVSDPTDRFEREAAATADRVMSAPARPGVEPRADSLNSLQQMAGNRAVGQYLEVQRQAVPVIQRQPEPLPNVGPPVSEVPKPPIISIVGENGKLYWKIEGLPGVGSTPKIPLDPRDTPAEVREKLGKVTGGGGTGPGGLPSNFPATPVTDALPPNWLEDMCKRDGARTNPLCIVLPPAGPPTPQPLPTPTLPILTVLWTDRVTFQHDRPLPGSVATSAMTPGGKSSLDSIVSWLKLDANLRVRLVGHASAEGSTEHNQQLSTRRVRMVARALTAAGFGDRVQDPLFSDGRESGCLSVGTGMWSCGDAKAAAPESEPDPEERAVEVSFFREPKFTLELTPPGP